MGPRPPDRRGHRQGNLLLRNPAELEQIPWRPHLRVWNRARLGESYLRPLGKGRFAIADAARDRVRFARHNLVADPTPPPGAAAFDAIVCRHVLIYFDIEEPRRRLERREADALRTACGARPKLVGNEGRGA